MALEIVSEQALEILRMNVSAPHINAPYQTSPKDLSRVVVFVPLPVHLWGHVALRTGGVDAHQRRGVDERADAEVGQLDVAVRSEQKVVGLQICDERKGRQG